MPASRAPGVGLRVALLDELQRDPLEERVEPRSGVSSRSSSGQCDLPGPDVQLARVRVHLGMPVEELAEEGAAGALHLGDQHQRLAAPGRGSRPLSLRSGQSMSPDPGGRHPPPQRLPLGRRALQRAARRAARRAAATGSTTTGRAGRARCSRSRSSELDVADREAPSPRGSTAGTASCSCTSCPGSSSSASSSARARRVHCGNLEIYEGVRGLTDRAEAAWAPGLITDRRAYEPAGRDGLLVRDGAQDPHRHVPAAARPARRARHVRTRSTCRPRTTRRRRSRTRRRSSPRCTSSSRASTSSATSPTWRSTTSCGHATFFAAFFDTRRPREQHVGRGGDGDGRGRDHQPRRALAARVRAPRERDRHRALRGAARPTPPCSTGSAARAVETAAARGWDALVARMTA